MCVCVCVCVSVLKTSLLPTTIIDLLVDLFSKCQRFAGSSSLNVRVCCVSSSFMIVDESSGFRLLAGQKKQFEDVTLSSGGFTD